METSRDTPVDLDALARRLAELEARVERLEGPRPRPASNHGTEASPASPQEEHGPGDPGDPFWVLNSLEDRFGTGEAMVFAGRVETPDGQRAEYQWTRPSEYVLQKDWTPDAESLAALGHSLRLTILRSVLLGTRTVTDLVVELGLPSTGVAYHHVHQLTAAGWLHSPTRGQFEVPVRKRIPLLAIMTALDATSPAQ